MNWKKIRGGLAAVPFVLCLLQGEPAMADPPPLTSYGDLPGIEEVAISPSGKNMAILGRVKGDRQLIVLDSDHNVRAAVSAGDAKIRDLRWIGEDEVMLLTSVTQTLDPIFYAAKSELMGALVVPLDGSKPWLVFDKTQYLAKTIYGDFGTRLIDGKWQGFFSGLEYANTTMRQEIIGSRQGVYAIDMKTNSVIRRVAEDSASGLYRSWLIDAGGRIAAKFELGSATGHWEIKNQQGTVLASGTDPTGDVDMISLGRDGTSVIYSLEDDKSDANRWYEVPLAGGTPVEIFQVLSIAHLYIDKADGKLIGYVENGVGARPHFFDPARQAVVQKVFRAFPKLDVELKDWTPDFSHILVRTSGNGDSGSWYIIDMAHLSANPVGSERPLILPQYVGAISTVTYHAADGMELDGVLTLPPGREAKNLPVVLLPHGGPGSRDEPVFDWWAQAFASRGYAVFQPNFRGSTNRDEAFRRAGFGQWGRKMQSDVSDGLAELARQGIVDPKRACIMGGSYGGYAALAGVTLQHGIYRCAVAVAGVSDLGELYATSTRNSGYAQVVWRSMRESLGAPSTFDEVSPRRHAAQADAPILLIHGKDDTVVPFSHSTAMAGALKAAGKPYEFVVMANEDHWLSRSATRKQMLEAAVAFVEKNNPAN